MQRTRPWRNGLSREQIRAAEHIGSHARLVAGPGTGKTRVVTRRVLALVVKHDVDPSRILVLTFTRVAAYICREELRKVLERLRLSLPYVSTLHSFALRQLLRNSRLVDALPKPVRIADKWETRHLIAEDLKRDLQKNSIDEITGLFKVLSAGWEKTSFGDPDWQQSFPDGAFLAGWDRHRRVFGYTLLDELVYQFLQALDLYPSFRLDAPFEYLLVDEFQDLNPCDLRVVRKLCERGMEVFASGDDDQSIYGFRHADPGGIRNFLAAYPSAVHYDLHTCWRCDRRICQLAGLVIAGDTDKARLQKKILPRVDSGEGEIYLCHYCDEADEARGIAAICQGLKQKGVALSDILILMRNDLHGRVSKPIVEKLEQVGLPAAGSAESPFDDREARLVLAYLRMVDDPSDSLAWRTALELGKNNIGSVKLEVVRRFAEAQGIRFASALRAIEGDHDVVRSYGRQIAEQVRLVGERVSKWRSQVATVQALAQQVCTELSIEADQQKSITDHMSTVATETSSESLNDVLRAISASLVRAEQDMAAGVVNIRTMHKAKGLDSDTVIIVGVEKEIMPGSKKKASEVNEERRMFYVSLSRAKRRLYMTYCSHRTGSQQFVRDLGRVRQRHVTTFLKSVPTRLYTKVIHSRQVIDWRKTGT